MTRKPVYSPHLRLELFNIFNKEILTFITVIEKYHRFLLYHCLGSHQHSNDEEVHATKRGNVRFVIST